MILNMVGGAGGGGLNFSVVGGSAQPGNPKENTIWVNTDTDITGWAFSATEPDSPVEGMVWIATGASSNADFNAIKKNCVQVYPFSAKQYISGAWVGNEAKIFQNGEWISLFNSEIYKNGMQDSALVSFATENHGYSNNVSGLVNRGSVVFGSSDITMQVPGVSADGASAQFVGTENTYPVSAFDKLIVEFSNLTVKNKNNSNYVIVTVTPQKVYPGTVAGSASKTIYQNSGATTIEVDISAITGDAYIVITGVQYYSDSSITAVISKIALK